jgi:hypothetical protein
MKAGSAGCRYSAGPTHEWWYYSKLPVQLAAMTARLFGIVLTVRADFAYTVTAHVEVQPGRSTEETWVEVLVACFIHQWRGERCLLEVCCERI